MERIIDGRGTGKTRKLLQYAYDNKLVVMCNSPERMHYKATAYGFPNIICVPYTTDLDSIGGPYVIDEIENFMTYCMSSKETPFVGYTLSNED